MSEPLYRQLTACTSVLVGKKATADGSTLIARNEDSQAAWPKHLTIHPHQKLTTAPHFVSKDTGFSIDLPLEAAKYTATPEWTDEYGLFEEDGINEYGVAMSGTESAYSNSRVLGFDPYIDNGIAEEAMITVVLPYVKTAREGVARLGAIVSEYGTTESNGILFSDVDEVWYLEIGSGHHWVAQRIPDDSYAVVANQLAIQEVQFDQPDWFMTSDGIQDFVRDNHLWQADTPFNFRDIFGTKDQSDLVYNTPRVWYGQKLLTPSVAQQPQDFNLPFLRQADAPIQVEDVARILGSHYEGTVYDPIGHGTPQEKHAFRPISLAKTQESHILQMRPNLPVDVSGLHWLSMGVTAQSVYVPFYAGADDVPVNYQKGTKDYSQDSIYWTYKLAGILVDAHYAKFAKDLEQTQKHINSLMVQNIVATDQAVAAETDAHQRTLLMTKGSAKAAQLAQHEMERLTAKLITDSANLSPLNFTTDSNL
ncbi:C69 family dipeptidase [Latilactobacillus curvatus]|uniref:C69 family dipeptidase n=1 Tax=Latilactobacillus curvatus TaxID=28038 RepID=UPI0020C8133B|nr:C69 family dipeptidase [Latilactobacillus curvatus]MCP8859024.1 C69 family dipeptidase [Latilactobacillus curvatus]